MDLSLPWNVTFHRSFLQFYVLVQILFCQIGE